MKNYIVVLFIGSLVGCSYFIPPREHPMLTNKFDEQSGFVVSATDANRRVALINLKSGQVCVEPPPEAANTISEAFSALFKADIENKADIATSLSQSITQNITQLYRRSQTVQLFRDSVFSICQNAINGQLKISPETNSKLSGSEFEEVKKDINDLKDKVINFEEEKFQKFLGTGEFNINDLYNFSSLSIDDNNDENETKELTRKKEDIKRIMRDNLYKDEYVRQVSTLLSQSYISLQGEFKYFYDTERLRFIAELAKPVQVCSNVPIKLENDKVYHKQVCKAEVPKELAPLIEKLIKAIAKEK
ncbi:hypothetical protein MTF66_06545 [Pseudoalteromonas sp. 2CM39R]|uniref:hypothetical protein n=1 Tax=Pseudoalteromonas sp. 2CM39R TaxID=2929856 RepID=UPI0020C00F23|nr:hypothetical protein [Pseudoalteromonas sp. 2CM39R]MCK8124650.1 hypothetical protein [Pseudoalteromonas sp. 2CM39R]